MKLSSKLTIIFVFTILLSIIAIFLVSNTMINNRFEDFLETEQNIRFGKIHQEINNLYIENELYINEMSLMHYAMTEDIDITLKNNDGEILYTTENRMGRGLGMNRHGMNMMQRRIPNGDYVEKNYPLIDNNEEIGTLIIGYIDNSYLTNSAIIFKETLTKSLMISGLIAIIIGILVSILMSRSLTNPIINITNTADKIRSGNLAAKSNVKTNTTEIITLSETINYLGDSLSNQYDIRRRYASDISHELRTPITTLKTHIEAFLDGIWEPTAEHLEILMTEVNRLSNLVEDLRDSFIQEEYSMHLDKIKFNVSAELENIITSYKPLYSKKNYDIKSSIEKNIEIDMDLNKFKQIVNNILSNSFKYLSENGNVFVELKKVEKDVLLIVRDNGIGIKEDDLKHIFERFYRVDTSRNKNTGGSGLGLSIVKSIVEAHNGTIAIESEFGKGTEVVITIPM